MDKLQQVLEENIGNTGMFYFSTNEYIGGKLTAVFPHHVVIEVGGGAAHYVMLARVAYFMFHRKSL